jgi:hypothetical protein
MYYVRNPQSWIIHEFCTIVLFYSQSNHIQFLKKKGFPCKLKCVEEMNRWQLPMGY